MTVNKAVTMEELRENLVGRNWGYALPMLDAMYEKAGEDGEYAANLALWLGDHGEYTTVFLRDELCRPFEHAAFLEKVKVHGYPYPWNDSWMALDSSAHAVRLSKFKMIRARFRADPDDPRPVNWPVKHPYWVTGHGEDYSILVAYADNEEDLLASWPEAHSIDVSYVDEYVFTDRFAKPDWFEEPSDE